MLLSKSKADSLQPMNISQYSIWFSLYANPSFRNINLTASIMNNFLTAMLSLSSPMIFCDERKDPKKDIYNDSLKEAQSVGVRQITRKFTNSTHFSAILFSHSHFPIVPAPLYRRISTPLALRDSSFGILIPPQRGADNLGGDVFKLAPLTRYTAR